jgi:hypothetical protein
MNELSIIVAKAMNQFGPHDALKNIKKSGVFDATNEGIKLSV